MNAFTELFKVSPESKRTFDMLPKQTNCCGVRVLGMASNIMVANLVKEVLDMLITDFVYS